MRAFEWTNPTTVSAAVKLLTMSAPGDVDEAPRPIAGGQDLLTTMKDYTSRPSRLVNLKNIRGLDRIMLNAKGLTIGALVTLSELEGHAGVRKRFPGLSEAA
ncbi:MAG TPA: FAD binding domain-containing protein, partial [Pyrinomonadaceae bacterium]|nr:FAD binding domain-containing protein [Pyrinomonadaceae bacterium]